MTEDSMLQQVIAAIQEGDHTRARDLLTRMIKATPNNSDYWVWMSSVVDNPRERTYCLQEALRLNPQNQIARRGLILTGGLPPDEGQVQNPPIRRKWTIREPVKVEIQSTVPTLPLKRLIFYSASGIVAVGLLIFGLIFIKPAPRAPAPTQGPPPTAHPSATFLPTNTLVVRTRMPTFVGPTPLWMLLPATYTPTPFYGSTPHPLTEAYRSGVKRFEQGAWDDVIMFMQQVIVNEPYASDAHYYMGEAYRNKNEYDKAIEEYDRAIQTDMRYAPAYLGRARAAYARDAGADVLPDLQKAIELDPQLGEAYLMQAALYLAREDIPAALASLVEAEQLLPESPWVYLYEARANLAINHIDEAVNQARKANQLDRTLLSSYRTLAEALQAAGKPADSLEPIGTYLIYASTDAKAQVMLAKAYLAWEKPDLAIQALGDAIAADNQLISAYLLRGEIYLDQQNPTAALEDFNAALEIDAKSIPAYLDKTRALLVTGDYKTALQQMKKVAQLAKSESELAGLYYWRAQVYEGLEESDLAREDWQALIALPAEALQPGWADFANQHLAPQATPTPPVDSTPTP